MKKAFITGLLTLMSFVTFSQTQEFQAPNYEQIKKDIEDPNSSYYYSKLIDRFNAFDTTLTLEESRHLYFGYIFQKEYSPYGISLLDKVFNEILKKDSLLAADYDKLISLGGQMIKEFPFSLRTIDILAYIYHTKGNDEMANKLAFKYQTTINAILSSGNGKTCETGFHVITVSHEYAITQLFRLSVTSQALIKNCDYLEVKDSGQEMKGIYFNISKMFETLSNDLK
jgi:hypothetical protein